MAKQIARREVGLGLNISQFAKNAKTAEELLDQLTEGRAISLDARLNLGDAQAVLQKILDQKTVSIKTAIDVKDLIGIMESAIGDFEEQGSRSLAKMNRGFLDEFKTGLGSLEFRLDDGTLVHGYEAAIAQAEKLVDVNTAQAKIAETAAKNALKQADATKKQVKVEQELTKIRRKRLNMESATKKYNELMAIGGRYHKQIGEYGTENWNIRDMISEVQSLLDTYYEDGHANGDLRHGTKDEKATWRSEVGKLERFIKANQEFAESLQTTQNHMSKFDNTPQIEATTEALETNIQTTQKATKTMADFMALWNKASKNYTAADFGKKYSHLMEAISGEHPTMSIDDAYAEMQQKEEEHQKFLEESARKREAIAKETQEFLKFAAPFENEINSSEAIIKEYATVLSEVSNGALSAADAIERMGKAMQDVKGQQNVGTVISAETQKRISDLERSIKNQEAWLRHLDVAVNEDRFKTSGKKAATEQLREEAARWISYNQRGDDGTEEYAKERRIIALTRAYREAERQGVAQSTLNRYYTNALYDYDESLQKLQKEYDFRKNLLEKHQAELNSIKQATSAVQGQVEDVEKLTSSYEGLAESVQKFVIANTKVWQLWPNTKAVSEFMPDRNKYIAEISELFPQELSEPTLTKSGITQLLQSKDVTGWNAQELLQHIEHNLSRATEIQNQAVREQSEDVRKNTREIKENIKAKSKLQSLSDGDKNILVQLFKDKDFANTQGKEFDPIEELSLRVSAAGFRRLRPRVKDIMNNAVSQLGLEYFGEAVEHYLNEEVLANSEALLFTLFEDYFKQGIGQLSLDKWIEEIGGYPEHRNDAVKMLNGLSVNYPDLINFSDTFGLGSINLKAPSVEAQEKLTEATREIAPAANRVTESIKKLLVHAGYLGNIENTLPSFPLGHVIPTVNGSGISGLTGLYAMSNNPENMKDSNGFAYNEWHGAKLNFIDPSFYKLFDATSNEMADQLGTFISELHATIYGYAMDAFTGDMVDPSTLKTVKELYSMLEALVDNINMDFDEFKKFVEDSQAVVAGHKFEYHEFPDIDKGIAKSSVRYLLQGVSDEVFQSDSFGTQLLKRLGFEGYDVSGTKYDGTYTGGSVVFEVKPESIVERDVNWSDAMKRIGFEVSKDDLQYEKKRAQLDVERAKAYTRTTQQLADGIKAVEAAAESAVASQEKLTDATKEVSTASEQAAQSVEEHATAVKADTQTTELPKLTVSERQKAFGDGSVEKFLSNFGIQTKDASAITDTFNEMARITKAIGDAIENDADTDEYMLQLNECIEKATDEVMKLGSAAGVADEELKRFHSYMTGETPKIIKYNNAQSEEFGTDWKSTRARFMKHLTTKEHGIPVDTLWQELLELFPALFDVDTANDSDQLKAVLGMLQKAKDAKKNNFQVAQPLLETDRSFVTNAVLDMSSAMYNKMFESADNVLETEEAVVDTIQNANQARSEGVKLNKQIAAAADDESGDDRPVDANWILKQDEARAIDRARLAKLNKTPVVDLSGVYDTADMDAQVRNAAQNIVGDENLTFAQLRIRDNIASIKLFNKELGKTVVDWYEVVEATDDATQSQLKYVTSTLDYNAEAARKYTDAQKAQVDKDNRWLIQQLAKLDKQEISYKDSNKKIAGDTKITETGEQYTDHTIDSLAASIRKRVQDAMNGALTEAVRNEITDSLRVLDKEIKTTQARTYVKGELSAQEVTEAKATKQAQLNAFIEKAKNHNVYAQLADNITQMQAALDSVTEQSAAGIGTFVDKLRTAEARFTEETAKQQGAKQEEQELNKLLKLQDQLYRSKEKLVKLESYGDATPEWMKTTRRTEELEEQYNAALDAAKGEENINKVLERQITLESELDAERDRIATRQAQSQDDAALKQYYTEQNERMKAYAQYGYQYNSQYGYNDARGKTADDQTVLDRMSEYYRQEETKAEQFVSNIKSTYNEILSLTNQINTLDTKMNDLSLKDKGSGLYAGWIQNLQTQKSSLVADLRALSAELANSLSVEPSNGLKAFFNDARVQATLTTEEMQKFTDALMQSENIRFNFGARISAQIEPVVERISHLKQMVADGLITDKGTISTIFGMSGELNRLDEAFGKSGSQADAIDYLKYADGISEYVAILEKAAQKEAQYFANKKQYANIQSIDDYTSAANDIANVSDSASKAKASLEEFVKTFANGKAIVTGFTTSADGISKINFSVFEEGTNQFRTFSAEMGQFTDKVYTVETSMKNLTAGTDAVNKAMQSISELGAKLNNIDGSEGIRQLLAQQMQKLKSVLAEVGDSKDAESQTRLKNVAEEVQRVIKDIAKLEVQWSKTSAAIANGDLIKLGDVDKSGDIQAQMLQLIGEKAEGAAVKVQGFDAKTNTLNYTLTDTDGTVTSFTAHLDKLTGTVTSQQGNVRKLKNAWQDLGGGIKGIGKEIGKYAVNMLQVMDIIRYLRNGFNAVKEIDLALTELKKVTDESELSYRNFLQTASKTAGQIGSTVSNFTEATANFARLGYDMDTSADMAKTAIVYKNVADGIDSVEESTESIISTMKAFGIESDNTMSIVDKFNAVGNAFAITSAGIGEALQRSASALYEGGNTIDEAIALVTAANSVIQNPEQVGTALKTLTLRLRGAKTELEEAGLETENMAESTSTLQAKLKALTHGRVDIMSDANTFKSTTQILREMAGAYEHMTDIERAAALELMGGKRQANILASLIKNFDTVEKVIETSLNSEGSALAENEKYLDSIQGKIDQFNNSTQTMWMNFMNSDVLKFLIDVATGFVKIADSIGLIPIALGAFAGKTAWGADSFGQFFKFDPNAAEGVNKFSWSLKGAAKNAQGMGIATQAAAIGTQLLNSAMSMGITMLVSWGISKAFEAIDNWIHRAEILKEKVEDMTDAYKTAKKEFEDDINTLTISSDTDEYDTLVDEFTELAKGVDKYGRNISLASDEYERYKQICEAIVGINPSIAAGYDSATEAIGNNVGILTTLIDKQKEAARLNAAEFVSYGIYANNDNFNTMAENAIKAYEQAEGTVNNYIRGGNGIGIGNILLEAFDWNNVGTKEYGDPSTNHDDLAKKIMEAIGFEPEEIDELLSDYYNEHDYFQYSDWYSAYVDKIAEGKDGIIDVLKTDRAGEDDLNSSIDTINEWADGFDSSTGNLEAARDNMIDAYLQIPYALKEYDELSDSEQSFIAEWIKNNEMFKIDEDTTQDDISKAKQTIINVIRSIANDSYVAYLDDGTTISAQTILDQMFDINPSSVSFSKYKESMQELIGYLWDAIGGEDNKLGFADKNSLAVSLGFELVFDEEQEDSDIKKLQKNVGWALGIGTEKAQEWLDKLPASTVTALLNLEFDWGAIVPGSMTEQDILALLPTIESENITVVKTYSALTEESDKYNEVLAQTAEITTDNTEVTQEYKDSLKELGISEEELNECFDENNDLVVTNAKGLNDLVKAAKKNTSQNIKLAKSQAQLDYYELYKEMRQLTKGQKVTDQLTLDYIDSLYDQMSALEKTIAKYSILEAKLLGTSNAYDRLAEAQEIDEATDYGSKAEEMVNVLGTAFHTTELGTESAQVAIDGLIPDSVFEDADTLDEKMQKIYEYFTGGPVSKLFTIEFDDDGGISSVEMTKENVEEFTKSLIGSAESGAVFQGTWDEFTLNPAITSMEEFADALGVTEEVAFAYLTELEKFDISWLGGNFSTMMDQLMSGDWEYQMYDKMQRLADLEMKIAKGTITSDERAEYSSLTKEMEALEAQAVQNVVAWSETSTALDSAKQELIDLNEELEKAKNAGDAWDGRSIEDIEKDIANTQEEVDGLIQDLDKLDEPTEMYLTVASDEVQEQILEVKENLTELVGDEHVAKVTTLFETVEGADSLDDIGLTKNADGTWSGVAELMTQVGLDPADEAQMQYVTDFINLVDADHTINTLMGEGFTTIEEHLASIVEILQKTYELQVQANVDDSGVDSFISWLANTPIDKTISFYAQKVGNWWNDLVGGNNDVNGTAHARGTAYKSGSWGVPQTEDALVGELGQELIVEPNGKWHTVGDNGAEFTHIKRGSIVFNHKQTEDLLSKGYVTGRGKMSGNAFAGGLNNNFAQPNTISDDELRQYVHLLNQYDQDVHDAVVQSNEYIQSLDDRYKQYGNIDNTNRHIVFWNEEAYNKHYPYIEDSAADWNMNPRDFYEQQLQGSWSTVLGESKSFGFNGQQLEIAFTQMLDDFGEVLLLTGDELESYVFSLMEQSLVNGQVDPNKMMELDSIGIDQLIQGETVRVHDMLAGVEGQIVDGVALSVDDILAMANPDDVLKQIETKTGKQIDSIYRGFSMHDVQAEALIGKYYEQFGGNSEAFIQLEELSYQYGITLDELIGKLSSLPEAKVTNYTIDGTGSQTLDDIKAKADNIPSNISTTHTTYETTVYTPGNKQYSGWTHTGGGGRYAMASGTVNHDGFGAPKTETALVGELGPEMRVRGNRWELIGQNGAEFADVRKGDIIFNHKQTEDLLSKGYVTGRGKAYAYGTSGTAYRYAEGAGGNGSKLVMASLKTQAKETDELRKEQIKLNKATTDVLRATGESIASNTGTLQHAGEFISTSSGQIDTWSGKSSASDYSGSKSGSGGGGGGGSSDAKDDFEELFDWIEVRIEEINEDISLKGAKLENAVGSSKQNVIIDDMIELNKKLYDNLTAGAAEYYAYSKKLLEKVPAEYREAAQDGAIAIEEFAGSADEETLNAIQEYREWVQKGADATQQAEETLTEISNLAKQAIDNIVADYENKASLRENEISQLEAYNELLETTYGSESAKIYKELINETNKNIKTLQEQRNKMQAELNAQVKAGNIKKYSQNWYDAVSAIAEVDTSIIELTTDTKDYQDSINELHWEHFDLLMSQYEAIADETENLIDILSADELVDEAGNWTKKGIASLGLYAQQMEVAEMQAKKYKDEISYLNKNWKKLGYTEEEYLDKLEELKSGQYDAIKAYNDTKDAIVDLNSERVDAIKEGIEKEIEAYEELIEKKKEELSAEKD